MQRVLDETDVALLSLSRPLLREPDWPDRLRRGLSDASRCISCNRCYSTPGHRCVFRASDGGELTGTGPFRDAGTGHTYQGKAKDAAIQVANFVRDLDRG